MKKAIINKQIAVSNLTLTSDGRLVDKIRTHKPGAETIQKTVRNNKTFGEIEFKKDAETGKFYLIEVNTRTTNFNSMLYKVGLNMPYIAYRELTGDPLEPKAVTENTGIFFWYAYEDFFAVKDYIKTGQLKLIDVIKSYNKPKAYAIWDVKDPKPAFVFLGSKVKRLFQKIFRTN